MKGFLAAVIVVLLAAGGLAVAVERWPTKDRVVPVDERDLREGQTEVAGVATLFKADNAVPAQPLATPFTVPRGAATISGAVVGGVRSTIVWDGGRPFAMDAAGGGLHFVGGPVEVDAAGAKWTLDGTSRLVPGRYRLRTPVAVGTSGFARPRDAVEFDADEGTTVAFRNGAVATWPLTPLTLTGPGTVRIEGQLASRARDDDAARPVDVVTLQGSYEATLTPGVEGLRVMGLFQRG